MEISTLAPTGYIGAGFKEDCLRRSLRLLGIPIEYNVNEAK
jgi:hypothetical protein